MACRNGISRIPMSKTTTLTTRCSSFGTKCNRLSRDSSRSSSSSTSTSCGSVAGGGGSTTIAITGGAVIADGGTANHNANYDKSASSSSVGIHLVNSPDHETTETELLKREDSVESSASPGNSDTMAGDIRLVNVNKNKQPRKQWTLRDRSEMSVHLLKANLAEDGCDKAQLDMAKKLLSQDGMDSSPEVVKENARLAVYWLIKSSEQGNDEATRLLKETLSAGRGITGQNILDVKTCISTPTNEKLTFRAARLLYQKLSNGEEFITTNQLLAHIHPSTPVGVVDSGEEAEEPSNLLNDTNVSDESLGSNDEFFTFIQEKDNNEDVSNIKQMEVNKLRIAPSKLHLMNTTFTLPSPTPAIPPPLPTSAKRFSCLNSKSILQETNCEDENKAEDETMKKVNDEEDEIILPQQDGVKLTLDHLLQAASLFNAGRNPVPTIDSEKREQCKYVWRFFSFVNLIVIQSLITAALCDRLSVKESSLLAVGYFTVWSSYNLLLWNKRHSNFKDWSLAFGSVLKDRQWTDELAEVKLSLRLLLPYLICHAVSLLVVQFTEGLSSLKLPVGMLVIFSLSRGVIKTRGMRLKVIAILCLSSLSNISGTAVTSLGKLLDIGGFGDFHVSSWIEDTYSQMHKMLPPLPNESNMIATSLQLILITSLVWTRKSLVVSEVIPEIIGVLWVFKLFQIPSELSTSEIIVSLGLFVFVAIVLLAFESGVQTRKLVLIITLLLIFVISGGAGLLVISGNKLEVWSNVVSHVNPIKVKDVSTTIDVTRLKLLPWEEYDASCHRRAWKHINIAETQLKCYKKYGKSGSSSPVAVKWNSRISLVKVKEIGEATGTKKSDIVFELNVNIVTHEESDAGSSWQSFLPGTDKDHLVPASVLISTFGCNAKDKQVLIDHVLSFRTGDKVEFYGMLEPKSAGSLRPEIVNVHSFKCSSCAIVEDYIEHFIHPSKQGAKATSTVHKLDLMHGGTESEEKTFSKVIEQLKSSVETIKSLLGV